MPSLPRCGRSGGRLSCGGWILALTCDFPSAAALDRFEKTCNGFPGSSSRLSLHHALGNGNPLTRYFAETPPKRQPVSEPLSLDFRIFQAQSEYNHTGLKEYPDFRVLRLHPPFGRAAEVNFTKRHKTGSWCYSHAPATLQSLAGTRLMKLQDLRRNVSCRASATKGRQCGP